MTTPAVGSKPTLITALAKTWRKSAEHLTAQLWRFVRLTALCAIPSLSSLLLGGKFDWRTLLAFVAPFAEVAWRQLHPALPAAAVDSAPGVTIVPEQVSPRAVDNAVDGGPQASPQPVENAVSEGDAAP